MNRGLPYPASLLEASVHVVPGPLVAALYAGHKER